MYHCELASAGAGCCLNLPSGSQCMYKRSPYITNHYGDAKPKNRTYMLVGNHEDHKY